MRVCPNAENHTPMPDGYLARQEWARMMARAGAAQTRCRYCGLYTIWICSEPIQPEAVPQTCFFVPGRKRKVHAR